MDSAMNVKRDAWGMFLAQQGQGPIDPLKFRDYAKPAENPFHDDFEWNHKEIIKDYFEKRSLNLVIKYSTIFNTKTADQRLHSFIPMALKEKGIQKKMAATAEEIAKDENHLAQVRAAIWSRLRRVVSDMYDFRDYLPEFSEVYEFLHPRAVESLAVRETVKKS